MSKNCKLGLNLYELLVCVCVLCVRVVALKRHAVRWPDLLLTLPGPFGMGFDKNKNTRAGGEREGGGTIKENETIADCLEIKGSCCFCMSLSKSYFHSPDRDSCVLQWIQHASLATEDALPWLEFMVRSRSHLIRRPQLCTHSVTRSGGAACFAVRLRWEFFFAPKLA